MATEPRPADRSGPPLAGGDHALADAVIAARRELFGVDDDTLSLLAGVAHLVEADLDAVIEEFYRRQLARPEVAAKIGEPAVLARLKQAQRRYVRDLFGGRCDSRYLEHRLRIGRVHEKLEVDPQHYLAALRLLRELIVAHLRPHLQQEPARREAIILALDRLLTLDSALVIDTYIANLMGEVEHANARLQRINEALEHKVAERTRELEEQARRDPLTDLYNARALREHLGRALAHARRRGRPLTLIYFDVDHFKEINDTGGHAAGDRVLRSIGTVLRAACRQEDIPCRYGGDEFCVVVVDADLDRAEALGERICERFAACCAGTTLSLGLAQTGPDRYDDPDMLIDRADRKMYEAKRTAGFQIRR
jgi:diguanylate cyclase (GGDEF)-like protein